MGIPSRQTDRMWRQRLLRNWIRRGAYLDFWSEVKEEETATQAKQLLQMQQYMALLPPGSRCPCNRIVMWLTSSEQHWPCCGHYKRLAKFEIPWDPVDGSAWDLRADL